MNSPLRIGVLALQGDFERHLYRLQKLMVDGREVRQARDLDNLDGLIIPGGESTTMTNLIKRFGLHDDLAAFARRKAVWGTCAGMIMLADKVDDDRVRPLRVIDIAVVRNGYGRQVYSFFDHIEADLDSERVVLPVSFIRAPRVVEVSEGVTVLARYRDDPVLLRKDNVLVSSFHTELDDSPVLLKYYLERMVSVYD